MKDNDFAQPARSICKTFIYILELQFNKSHYLFNPYSFDLCFGHYYKDFKSCSKFESESQSGGKIMI